MYSIRESEHDLLLAELKRLDESVIIVDGKEMKPCQCYHLGLDPVHVLFNENCPEFLKTAITDILRRYRYI